MGIEQKLDDEPEYTLEIREVTPEEQRKKLTQLIQIRLWRILDPNSPLFLRWDDEDILYFKETEVDTKFASQSWPHSIDRNDVYDFFQSGYSFERIMEYDTKRIGGIANILINENIPAYVANSYPEGTDPFLIPFLHKTGIDVKGMKKRQIQTLCKLIAKTFGYDYTNLNFDNNQKLFDIKDLKYLGMGKNAVIFIDQARRSAIKVSLKPGYEFELLKRLDNPSNIIRLEAGISSQDYVRRSRTISKGKVKDHKRLLRGKLEFFEIDYINGDSLENILKKYGKLDNESTFHYAAGIMNGLIEMRRAGIFYHRDIRPANILINKENKALIIDFGIATTDKYALPVDNRRYGGPNDLTSLGQLMYKMATGEHLFADSRLMETTASSNKLKNMKDKVYSDKTGKSLDIYLEKVDRNIKDARLNTLIKSCLTAENFHYRNIWKMFKSYGAYA